MWSLEEDGTTAHLFSIPPESQSFFPFSVVSSGLDPKHLSKTNYFLRSHHLLFAFAQRY
jgi:hypothetical protein